MYNCKPVHRNREVNFIFILYKFKLITEQTYQTDM